MKINQKRVILLLHGMDDEMRTNAVILVCDMPWFRPMEFTTMILNLYKNGYLIHQRRTMWICRVGLAVGCAMIWEIVGVHNMEGLCMM